MTTLMALRAREARGLAGTGRFKTTVARLALEVIPDRPWISSFAASPRRLSDGKWVWLRPFEWRWARAGMSVPLAVQRPRLESRAMSSAI